MTWRGVGGLRRKVLVLDVIVRVVMVVGGNGARFISQTGQSTSQTLRIAFVVGSLLEQNTPAEWQFDRSSFRRTYQ